MSRTMHLCFKPTLSAVMSMATSIVTDLRIDRPVCVLSFSLPPLLVMRLVGAEYSRSYVFAFPFINITDARRQAQEDDPRVINCFKSNDFVKVPYSAVRTIEERRATLACYVFCSR